MKVRSKFFYLSAVLIVLSVSLPSIYAADAAEECNPLPLPLSCLPAGARAVLGLSVALDIAYSPDGSLLAIAQMDDNSPGSLITLYDVDTLGIKVRAKFLSQDLELASVAFSPDGRTLACGGAYDSWNRGKIFLWDLAPGGRITTFARVILGSNLTFPVSFSPDGKTIATISYHPEADLDFRRVVYLVALSPGGISRTLTGHQGDIDSLAFSPDGRTLVSNGGWPDNSVRLWDVATGELTATLPVRDPEPYSLEEVYCVAWSPTGNRFGSGDILASGRYDGIVRLWDVNPGSISTIGTLTEHVGEVWSVAFSPDGRTLASGDNEGTVRLWDVATGELTATLTGHLGGVGILAFSPDGRTLVSSDGVIGLLWSIPFQPIRIPGDVNIDGEVDIQDLVAVASLFGWGIDRSTPGAVQVRADFDIDEFTSRIISGDAYGGIIISADVNIDDKVDIQDLVAVAAAFGANAANAPAAAHRADLSPETLQQWIAAAEDLNLTEPNARKGIHVLTQLLTTLTPSETALLANYPNPFNPETWIPYRLATPAEVTLSIHTIDGKLVRRLDIGHRPAGHYDSRSRAAYWDGRNALGELVASGVYFYTLTAGEFTATRKMLISK